MFLLIYQLITIFISTLCYVIDYFVVTHKVLFDIKNNSLSDGWKFRQIASVYLMLLGFLNFGLRSSVFGPLLV